MVASSCLHLVARRLVLRKGLAITLGGLFLLGTVVLYFSLDQSNRPAGGRSRTVSVPGIQNRRVNVSNWSVPHPHQQSRPSLSDLPQPHRTADNGTSSQSKGQLPFEYKYLIPNTTEECVFSSTQPINVADVQMLEVFEKLPFDDPDGGVWKQGFDITYSMDSFKDDPLQVFVVPHSHNDPGWIHTFEDYYRRQTHNILNFVTDSLSAEEHRKFIWAEISYLDLWWQDQSENKRQIFHQLCESGQMEIVTGGWVMNDEANTHYFAMIDQLFEGHQWLQHNMPGIVPYSGWAIDPFGHTPTMAFLLRRIGFESMVVHRVHYAIKKYLAREKLLEFAWRQLWDQHGTTDMFCHMFPFYSYDVPHTCGPDPKICCQFDFKRLVGSKVDCPWRVRPVAITDGNVAERSRVLADQYRKKAQLYRTNVLLVPLGDDFRYDTQKEVADQFSNYDKLMKYMNSNPEMRINVQFGTLADYFATLRKKAGTSADSMHPPGFPSLTGDFYTYNDRMDNYWSGYFTSRPFYKNLDRVLEDNIRAAEVLHSLAAASGRSLDPSLPRHLTDARRSLGLFQHHDGITGTAKDPVVIDYAKKMIDAITKSKTVMAMSATSLLLSNDKAGSAVYFDLEETHPSFDGLPAHAVISVSSPRTIYVYNSLTSHREQLVRLLIDLPNTMVKDGLNNSVACQVGPVWVGPDKIVEGQYELVFLASVPPLGISQYRLLAGSELSVKTTIQVINVAPPQNSVFQVEQYPREDFILSTDYLRAKFSGNNGLLKSLATQTSEEVATEIDFLTYGTRGGREKSGAYLFLPDGQAQSILPKQRSPVVTISVGPLLQEVRTTLDMVEHSLQLYNSLGPEGRALGIKNIVDIRKGSNTELVMRVKSSIQNPDGVFYTDLNGLQLVRRRTVSKIPLQGNFYPMPTSVLLQDKDLRLSLLSRQSLGTASLQQGWLEVVLDRRLMQDDSRGLGQGVKDNKVTPSFFKLLLEQRIGEANPSVELAYHSLLAHANLDQLLHPVHTLITRTNAPPQLPSTYSGLNHPFPCDFHLVNLRSLFTPSCQHSSQAALILHRRGFDCNFSTAPVHCQLSSGKVELHGLFQGVKLSEVKEMTLTLLHELEHLPAMEAHVPSMDMKTYRLSW